MRGDHSQLTVTTVIDDATGIERPLFAFPVQICKATGSVDVKLDRATPHLSEYETVYRDKVTGEIFENDQLVKGVRSGESFTTIPADQIEAIDQAVSMDEMRVLRAVPLEEVPFDRATGFYYLQAPAKGGAHKAYRLTYEALRRGKTKAKPAQSLLVKFTSRTRQKLGVIYADEDRECLAMVRLTFAAELREPDEAVLAPQAIEVEAKQVSIVRKVIADLAAEEVDFDTPVDDAIELKRELVAQAAAGETVEVPPTPEAVVVAPDEIEASLLQSLEEVAAAA